MRGGPVINCEISTASFESTENGAYKWGSPIHSVCWRELGGYILARAQFFTNVIYDFVLGPSPGIDFSKPDVCGYGYIIDLKASPMANIYEVEKVEI